MRIALLCHKTGNIGHLFMAEGVRHILLQAFGKEIDIIDYEQHQPFCIYENLPILTRIKYDTRFNSVKKFLNKEKISTYMWKNFSQNLMRFDLAISVGGPNIVKNVYKSGDMQLMLHHMLGAFHYNKIRVLNLSNGSCFPLEDIPQQLDNHDILFWQRVWKYSYLITFRDKLAKKLLQPIIKYDAPLLPCPAFILGETFERFIEKKNNYIIINYQRKGANDDWGQKVDEKKWKNTIIQIIKNLKKRHKIIILCHNQVEEKIAKDLNLQDISILYPKNLIEYAKIISQAKAGLVSRLHASIPLAGIGVPTILIGTDTRLLSAELVGLKTYYVKDVLPEKIIDDVENLIEKSEIIKEYLFFLREKAKNHYIKILQDF